MKETPSEWSPGHFKVGYMQTACQKYNIYSASFWDTWQLYWWRRPIKPKYRRLLQFYTPIWYQVTLSLYKHITICLILVTSALFSPFFILVFILNLSFLAYVCCLKLYIHFNCLWSFRSKDNVQCSGLLLHFSKNVVVFLLVCRSPHNLDDSTFIPRIYRSPQSQAQSIFGRRPR